jgi:hypothetical protein
MLGQKRRAAAADNPDAKSAEGRFESQTASFQNPEQ